MNTKEAFKEWISSIGKDISFNEALRISTNLTLSSPLIYIWMVLAAITTVFIVIPWMLPDFYPELRESFRLNSGETEPLETSD